ncbi:MAG: hypothetical protein KQH63_11015 [Desulfobulbaceae bacterium]|nr:hypothetical protein [Desulfobulbaceae bacterium]
MKKVKKIFGVQARFGLFFGCLFLIAAACAQANDESGAELTIKEFPQRISYHSYSSLTELVTLVCDDAMQVFSNFYGPTKVAVFPFTVISDYKIGKMTMLGITMADQMTAMINSEPAADFSVEEKYEQKLEGVIEEMDGFLRVHISGRNVKGERRGHVVSVEMSEPIYRFLHSYVESY